MEPAGLAGALGELGGMVSGCEGQGITVQDVGFINTVHLGYIKCI